jgi:hypothetical protein
VPLLSRAEVLGGSVGGLGRVSGGNFRDAEAPLMAGEAVVLRHLSSSTMIVMMMASTPSVKASSRLVLTALSSLSLLQSLCSTLSCPVHYWWWPAEDRSLGSVSSPAKTGQPWNL